MNINASNLCAGYSTYKVNVDNVKQKSAEVTAAADAAEILAAVAEISPEGKALADKMISLIQRDIPEDVKHLSSVSTYEYVKSFESALAEQAKGDGKDCFTYHVNKMVSVYNEMRSGIEEKYSDTSRETAEYYVADNGNIEELTLEKELGMLDKAYENHSKLMAASTEIWSWFIGSETDIAKGEVRDLAYQAFMSAKASGEMDISSDASDKLNDIWDYYAKDVSAPEIDEVMRAKVQERSNAEYDEEDIMQAITDAYEAVYQKNEMFANPDTAWWFKRENEQPEETEPVINIKYTDEYINNIFSALGQAREEFLARLTKII